MHPPSMPLLPGCDPGSRVSLFGRDAIKPKDRSPGLPRAWRAAAQALVVGLLMLGMVVLNQASAATTLPTGFQEVTFASGLIQPTALRFAPDGRIFVAEKRGVVKVFNNLSDTAPRTLIDIRTNVYNFWDRGLMGLAVHPNFPSTPYVYVLYAYDGDVGMSNAPKYGTANTDSDPCPTPPGATDQGCVVSGRLSRFSVLPDANGVLVAGPEQVMISDWCQQFPSHSVGSLVFGHDGALYVSAGDGASWNYVDYGQTGNPCGDPPLEGGALRSQDLRTSANARRIIAHGLRNPFRINVRPGTNNEIWIGDVGWNTWEEINVIGNTTSTPVMNFGWPCYEGAARQPGYESANLPICQNLYAAVNAVTSPYYAYAHSAHVVANDPCPTGTSSIAGLAVEFYSGSVYPSRYNGALFFADYSRNCIWAMLNGTNGSPKPA